LRTKRNVAVVADSSISLPRELVEQYSVVVVPIELIFGDRVYRDGVDLDPASFYAQLKESPKPPTTSGPRPSAFLEAFQRAAEQADSILCLTLSSKLSSTYNSACSAVEPAAERLPGVTIRVVDTDSAAAAEGLIALEAARGAAAGWG